MGHFRNFVSVHCHPSSLDSGSTPESFAERECELETGALCSTDHGTLQSSHRTFSLAKEKGLIPLVGIEAYFRDDECSILTANGYQKNAQGGFILAPKYSHITLHAMDYTAYRCMVRLISRADLRLEADKERMEPAHRKMGSERKALFRWADLEELGTHNVTATSGCMTGVCKRHILDNDDPKTAIQYFERLKSTFKPGNFYVELNPHDTSHDWIQGVFITMIDGTEHKLYDGKIVMTDAGEIRASQLAKEWTLGKHHVLKSIKDRSRWREMPEAPIAKVEQREGFDRNECRPWAKDGNYEAALNRFMFILAKRHKIPVVIGDDCIRPDTVVRCEAGYKLLKDVSPGERVVAHDGTLQVVEATRSFITEKPMVTIDVGGTDVSMTEDHRVWAVCADTWPNGNMRPVTEETTLSAGWVYAGKLKKGDLVYVPKPSEPWGSSSEHRIDLAEFVHHRFRYTIVDDLMEVDDHVRHTTTSFSRFVSLDSDAAWLIGFFLGDGNAHNNLTSFVAETNVYTEHLRPRALAFCKRYGLKYDETDKKTHAVFRIINTPIAQFFRRNFYDAAKTKVVPSWLNGMSKEWIACVIRGVCYADGSSWKAPKYGTSRYTLSMTSLPVIGWVREATLKLGVYSSLSRRMTIGSVKELYTINFPREINAVIGLWEEKDEAPYERKRNMWVEDGGGFWIRIKSVAPYTDGDRVVCDLQIASTGSFSLGQFAVHNSHYATPDASIVQDVRLAQNGPWRFYTGGSHNTYHRMTSDEAWTHFQAMPGVGEKEFEGWIANSHDFASRFKDFKFESAPSLPTKFYEEEYKKRPWYVAGKADNSVRYTMDLIRKQGRMKWDDANYVRRLRQEIDLLHGNGTIDLLPYFMIDEDVVAQYEKAEILTGPGRGSAAGALITFLLGITHVDPLRFDLSLDRFLTKDRIASGKMPDIDQDLSSRDLLTGGSDYVEIELEDGTKKIVKPTSTVVTDEGDVTVQEAFDRGLDVRSWA